MQKLDAKSQGKKTKHLFENITPNTRETSAVRWSLQTQKKKSALKTNLPLKLRLPKEEYLHIKPLDGFQLNSLNRNEGKPKITAITLASGKFSMSAITMFSEEFDW